MPAIIDLTLTLPRHPGKPYHRRDVERLQWVVWHHTAGTDNPSTPDFEPEIIPPEAIARYHITTNGWSGIGYHFLIYQDGTIYKVRPIGVIGACVGGSNTGSVCIAFVGNYELRPPAAIMLASGIWLTTTLLAVYPTLLGVRGHGEMPAQATACPGAHLKTALLQARSQEGWAA